MKYNYDEILNRTDLGKIILENTTISGIMRGLNLPTRGRLYSVFKKKILNAGYDLSHITGIPKYKHNEKTLDEHFSKNSTTKSNKIKTLLFKYGLKEKVCECCGITDWNGKPLVLQLHHIDGNPTNNTIENLQILCPNCHSQTDTYCNKKRNENKIVKKYVCERCGGEKNTKYSKYCKICSAHMNRKVTWPDKIELLKYINNGISNTTIGKFYGVTGNSVKRWRLKYNI